MTIINYKFYNDEIEYTDGPIEEEILNIVKNNWDLESIVEKDLRWPVFYHLSYLRENLFNWYPFKEDAELLEIGAGCGALTGLFCKNVSKVTAVELTERRSQIIYNRHKNYSNLEIFPGNLNNMNFEEKFDYIILCGVLEYAAQFTETNNPHVVFLKKIKSMLKEDGVILVAIENRLGLKYFSGSKEDHLGECFVGIENYPNIDRVKTFSRFELEDVIKRAGFTNYKFFYPYPDYKFPTVIHTDDLIEVMPFSYNAPNYDQTKIKLFNESSLNFSLSKDKISKYFSNSFLVELRNSEVIQESDYIKYCKLSANRDEKFRIGTKIFEKNGNLFVSKFPLNQKAISHVKKMDFFSGKSFGKIKCLNGKLFNDDFVYKYLEELNLSNILTNLLIKYSDTDLVINELKKLYDDFKFNATKNLNYHTQEFSNIFGDKKINQPLYCHNESNLDLILNNLFCLDEETFAIDFEWCFEFPIPIEFIFWRLIDYELNNNFIFNEFFTVEKIFDELELNIDYISIFKEWENNFLKYVKEPPLPKQNVVSGKHILWEANHYKKLAKNKEKEVNKLNNNLNKLKKDNFRLDSKIKLMESSKSWKITAPLRKIMNYFR